MLAAADTDKLSFGFRISNRDLNVLNRRWVEDGAVLCGIQLRVNVIEFNTVVFSAIRRNQWSVSAAEERKPHNDE